MFARALAAVLVTLLLAAPAFAQDEPPPPPAAAPEAPPPAVAPAPAAAPAAVEGAKRFAKAGVLEVGGGISMGYNYYETVDYKEFNLGLSPYVLYFIMKGLSIGGRFEVNYQKYWSGDESGSTAGIAIMPAAEYNFDLGGRLFPYAGLAFGYGYSESGSGDTKLKINQFRFVPEGGVKITFGSGAAGGILGLGLQVPVVLHAPDVDGADTYTQAGFAIVTRYAVWF
jgi:hypothetical protein